MRRLITLVMLAVPVLAAPIRSAEAQVHVYVPGIAVNVAPPPARVEVRSAAPSPGHMWINGHWGWRGGRHVWLGGHWAMPPGSGYTWAEARWVQQNGQWMFYEGHWVPPAVVAAPPTYVDTPAPAGPVVEVEPPAPIVEVRPATPYAGAVWQPGYWYWHGRHHQWVAGRWAPARAGWAWEAHHWERGPGGWHMVPGRWRRQ
jgi:hypothetical protein